MNFQVGDNIEYYYPGISELAIFGGIVRALIDENTAFVEWENSLCGNVYIKHLRHVEGIDEYENVLI